MSNIPAAAEPVASRHGRAVWLRKAVTWLLAGTGTLALLLAVYVVVMNCWGEARLQAALRELKASGLPTSIAEVRQRSLKEGAGDNRPLLAAFVLADAPASLTERVPGIDADMPALGAPVPEAMKQELKRFLEQQADCYRLLAEARTGLSGVLTSDAVMEQSRILDVAQGFRHAARHLSVRSLYAQSQGDSNGALDAFHAVLDLCTAVEDEPYVVMDLVRSAVIALALKDLQQTLSRCPVPQEELRRIRQRLATAIPSFDARRWLVKEIGYSAEEARNIERSMARNHAAAEQFLATVSAVSHWPVSWSPSCFSGPRSFAGSEDGPVSVERLRLGLRLDRLWFALCPGEYKKGLAKGLRHCVEIHARLAAPSADLPALAEEWRGPTAGALERYVSGWIDAASRAQTQLRVAITALLVEEYRLAKAEWPQDLGQAVSREGNGRHDDLTEGLQYTATEAGRVIRSAADPRLRFELLDRPKGN